MGGVVGAIAGPVISTVGSIFGGGGGGGQQQASPIPSPAQTLGGAAINSQAAGQAAGLQTQYGQQALGMAQGLLNPWAQAGQQALGQYQGLLGGGAAGFDLSKMPGYQFQMQQGLAGIEGSAAARGGSLSGNVLQGIQGYGQGLASTQFQNYMNQLSGLSQTGLGAATNLADMGSGLLTGIGNAQAAGAVYGASPWQSALQSPGVTQGINSLGGALGGALGNLFQPNNQPLQSGQGGTAPQAYLDPTSFQGGIPTGGLSFG